MRHFLSGFFLILLCAPAVGLAQDYSVYLTSGTFIPAETGPAVEPPASGEVFDGKFFRAIQFYAIPTEADKARLRAKGITLHRYLPNNLFTAILPAVNAQQALAGETNVRAVFKMSSLRKLSEGLQGGNYPAHATRPGGGIALVVTHQPGKRRLSQGLGGVLGRVPIPDQLRLDRQVHGLGYLEFHTGRSTIGKVAAIPILVRLRVNFGREFHGNRVVGLN